MRVGECPLHSQATWPLSSPSPAPVTGAVPPPHPVLLRALIMGGGAGVGGRLRGGWAGHFLPGCQAPVPWRGDSESESEEVRQSRWARRVRGLRAWRAGRGDGQLRHQGAAWPSGPPQPHTAAGLLPAPVCHPETRPRSEPPQPPAPSCWSPAVRLRPRRPLRPSHPVSLGSLRAPSVRWRTGNGLPLPVPQHQEPLSGSRRPPRWSVCPPRAEG